MRFFTLGDLQYEALAIFLGLLALIFICAAWLGYPFRRQTISARDEPEPRPLDPSRYDPEGHRIPPLLVLFYAGAAVVAVGYAIYTGFIKGLPF